tara:strand:- start:7 stop:384 length:378 start_codon:yes stop_codon:yes gene_type:complete
MNVILILLLFIVAGCEKPNTKEQNIVKGSMEHEGLVLFKQFGCNACHSMDRDNSRGPQINNIFNKILYLDNGDSILYDEDYIVESILEPNKIILRGYKPIMPKYKNLLSKEDALKIVKYLIHMSP